MSLHVSSHLRLVRFCRCLCSCKVKVISIIYFIMNCFLRSMHGYFNVCLQRSLLYTLVKFSARQQVLKKIKIFFPEDFSMLINTLLLHRSFSQIFSNNYPQMFGCLSSVRLHNDHCFYIFWT